MLLSDLKEVRTAPSFGSGFINELPAKAAAKTIVMAKSVNLSNFIFTAFVDNNFFRFESLNDISNCSPAPLATFASLDPAFMQVEIDRVRRLAFLPHLMNAQQYWKLNRMFGNLPFKVTKPIKRFTPASSLVAISHACRKHPCGSHVYFVAF